METVKKLREAIRLAFAEWEQLPRIPSHWTIVSVQDSGRDRYALQNVNFVNNKYNTSLLAYMEIREEKIWILTDNTEEGITTDLVRFGVPKSQIVLGFYSAALCEVGEFAVAGQYSAYIPPTLRPLQRVSTSVPPAYQALKPVYSLFARNCKEIASFALHTTIELAMHS